MDVKDFKDDFPLLVEAGFVAVKQFDEVSARRLFEAAQVLNPKSTAPKVGLGYIELNKLELKNAIKIFEGVVAEEPENYLAQTFLGMCLMMNQATNKKGEKMVEEAMAKSDDETVKNLGKAVKEWTQKELKKEKAPFFEEKATSKK